MKSADEIERLLRQTPAPYLAEGPHREQLKQQLLMQPMPIPQEERKMSLTLFARMSPVLKVAAIILAAALLVGAGWAAEKLYEMLNITKVSLTLEKGQEKDWTLPNGKKMTSSTTTVTVVSPKDRKAIASAQRNYEEMKELVGKKKYKFLRTFENPSTGETEYVYRFTLSDGTENNMNFSMPLDDVTSWDDYQRQLQQQSQHYQEEVNKAVAAGRYRLIDQDVLFMHICMDEASHKKIRVLRIRLPNGDEMAVYRPYEAAADEQATTGPESRWQEHLQAIREDKLELLGAETVPSYTYEVMCEDGTRRLLQYAGGKPLNESEAD